MNDEEIPIRCPSCDVPRPTSAQYQAALKGGDGSAARTEFADVVERLAKCCNEKCRGQWGTGCYHCHHPSYFDAESNSSAPLTGWTRDWPTADGWWWLSCDVVKGEPSPVFVYADADGDLYAHEEDILWSKAMDHRVWFHAMEQPPEPPKATP